MFVDDVVELVPPLPPLPKLSASTAVPGTRSNGSVSAAPLLVSAIATNPTMPRMRVPRPQMDLTCPSFQRPKSARRDKSFGQKTHI